MLRILHMSDIHFDSVYGRYPEVVRSALKAGLNKAFTKAVDFAIHKNMDVVVLAGDVGDKGDLSYMTETFIKKQLERLEGERIPVVVLHGNHDPSNQWQWRNMPSNVYVIERPEPVQIEMETKNGDTFIVHGNGFENKAEKYSNIEDFPVGDRSAYHIGVMHTFVAGGSISGEHLPYMQTSLNDLTKKKYDYWALGHIHKMQVWSAFKSAYSGSLQGLHAGETGPKGGLYVEIESPGAQPDIQFVDFSVIEFETLLIDINEEDEGADQDLSSLSKKVSEAIKSFKLERFSEGHNKSLILRVVLEGRFKEYEKLQNDRVVRTLEAEVREEAEVLFVEIMTQAVTPLIHKQELVSSSPFAAFIDDMLRDEEGKEALLAYAKKGQFAEMPAEEEAADKWLNSLLDRVGDEWLYKMVKSDEN